MGDDECEASAMVDLADSTVVGVADLTPDGIILSANGAFGDLIGRSAPVGTSFYELFDRDADRLRQACASLIEGSRLPGPMDVTVALPSGRHLPVEFHGAATRSDDSSPAGVTVTIIDRSDRTRAEAESARYRAIFEKIGELIGIMAPDGTVLSMNSSAVEFFGTFSSDRGLIRFVPESSVPYLMEEIMPSLRGTGRWEGEVGLLRHDGVEVPHHVTLQRHADPTHGDDYWWAIARDRSMVRIAAEAEALTRLNAAKDQFIAGVSHELRTPLTTIRGFADILVRGGASAPEVAEYTELIRHEAYAMSAIVEDLLVTARAESGHLTMVPRMVAIRSLVDEIAAILPGADGGIENLVSADAVAHADEMRCRQIIRNLLTNSIRHGGNRRWVESEDVGTDLLVRVCDDGAGVDPTLQESIFEAYVSRPNDGTRPESVGLGLTVCRHLARLMGGDVEFDHPGYTRFTLRLPRE